MKGKTVKSVMVSYANFSIASAKVVEGELKPAQTNEVADDRQQQAQVQQHILRAGGGSILPSVYTNPTRNRLPLPWLAINRRDIY